MSLKIEQAFLSDFIAQDFGLPIHHENTEYKPEPGSPYVAVKMFENSETAAALSGLNETDGFFQFTLFYPEGNGAMPAKAKRATMLAAFPVGRRLTFDGQYVDVRGTQPLSAAPDGGWFQAVGRVFYRANINT